MERYLNECTFTQFDEACGKHPANTAIIYLGERFSYAFLHELVERFAAGLMNAGVKTKEKVMLFIPNCPQWIIANFAINKIGGVVVPVSPIYTSYEIEYIINDAEVETVICLDTNFMYIHEVIGKTNLKRVIVTNLTDLIPFWKRVVGHMLDKLPKGKIKAGKEVLYFKEILKTRCQAPTIDVDPWRDLAYIMYTGGTTGFPKGVAGNHMGEVSYIKDIMENVLKGNIFTERHHGHGEPPFPYHGQGIRAGDGPQSGEHHDPDAGSGGGSDSGGDTKIQGSLAARRTDALPDDSGK